MSIADKLTTIAENEQKVYDAGYEKGKAEGGVQHSDYINPEWTVWSYFDYEDCRNSLVAKLKYNDTSNGWNFVRMFYNCPRLTEIPLFDTSKATSCRYMFQGCTGITEIPQFNVSANLNFADMFSGCSNLVAVPRLDTIKGSSFGAMFRNCSKLKTITELNLSSSAETGATNMFYACTRLENITFVGNIPCTLTFKDSTLLSKASIISIVNALATTKMLTLTLSLTAVNNAFETSEGAADGSTSTEWLELIATKSNWTISLS